MDNISSKLNIRTRSETQIRRVREREKKRDRTNKYSLIKPILKIKLTLEHRSVDTIYERISNLAIATFKRVHFINT